MFTYSLSGLDIKAVPDRTEEVEENETTARSAVYQVLGAFFAGADRDHYEKARQGLWAKELAGAAALLPFAFDVGEPILPPDVGPDAYLQEHLRLFGEGRQSRLCAGYGAEDRAALEAPVRREYEYYGLSVSLEGGRSPDHLTIECDFMQYLSFREAATGSERLRTSYRRAQRDFLERHLLSWFPGVVASVGALDPKMPFSWGLERLEAFLHADSDYVTHLLDP